MKTLFLIIQILKMTKKKKLKTDYFYNIRQNLTNYSKRVTCKAGTSCCWFKRYQTILNSNLTTFFPNKNAFIDLCVIFGKV